LSARYCDLSLAVAHRRIRQGLECLLRTTPDVAELFALAADRRYTWAIVGGAPRFWVTEQEGDLGDLDIALSASSEQVEELLLNWLGSEGIRSVSRTRFGGYRIRSGVIDVDIWPGNETVGIKTGRVSDSNIFRAIARSAALSIDSCVFTSRGTIYQDRFLWTLQTGMLGLNHWKPEAEEKLAKKALSICREYALVPDIHVQFLMAHWLGRGAVDDLLDLFEPPGSGSIRVGGVVEEE
jgi:hypothetical protein